jgi:hypothetical protein
MGNFQIIDIMNMIFQALGYFTGGIFYKWYYSFPLVINMDTHICSNSYPHDSNMEYFALLKFL